MNSKKNNVGKEKMKSFNEAPALYLKCSSIKFNL